MGRCGHSYMIHFKKMSGETRLVFSGNRDQAMEYLQTFTGYTKTYLTTNLRKIRGITINCQYNIKHIILNEPEEV